MLSEIAQPEGVASIRDGLGYIYHHLDNHNEATICYQRSIDLRRAIDDHYTETVHLTNLGDAHHSVGHADAARRAWKQALAIFNDLDHPDADHLRRKLQAFEESARR